MNARVLPAALGLSCVLANAASAELLTWWRFDEPEESFVVEDSSGNFNEGTLMNYLAGIDPDFDPAGGRFGGALFFDGIDDYVNNATGFQPTEAFTYAFFFRPEDAFFTVGSPRVDFIYSNARPHFSFSRDNGGDGRIGVYFSVGGDVNVKTTTDTWSDTEWHHVAFTYDGSEARAYVNGVLEGTLVVGGPATVQGDGRFNVGSSAGGSPFWGWLDDLCVWDEALGEAEVAFLAANGVEALVEQRLNDADADGLPDLWEQQIIDADPDDDITTIQDVLPGDDFDGETLTNRQEFDKGTNPTLADSDSDGLTDAVENGTGIWAGPTATGTDPREADSDEDGLLDGVENPDLPHDPANAETQPGTDPNDADSDGDTFQDGFEVVSGSDPTDANSTPEISSRILFLGSSVPPASGFADPAVMAFLEDRYGAENVDYNQSNLAVAGDELEYGVLILSSSPGSGTMRGKFQDSPIPVLNWEEAIAPNRAGEFAICSDRIKETVDHTIVIDVEHPITAGFPVGETVFMTNGAAEFWWSGGIAPGAVNLASSEFNPGNGFLTVIEAGDELLNGAPAPGRRVMMGFTDNTFNFLSDEGLRIFGQAVDWLLGIAAEPDQGLRVTEIAYDATNPDQPTVTLTWTSREGRTYTVYANNELEPIDFWGDLDDSIEADAGDTTTRTFALPAGQSRQFFVVGENP